ncbi:MAG: hypothetical protein JWR52_789 [Marmoricola sp.]|nr:hypothetical protein [Marmoricola sp.]
MDRRTTIDDRLRTRLRKAGRRFHAAETERRAAILDLKRAVLAADGRCTVSDAAELTGISSLLLEVIAPDLLTEEWENPPS